MPSPRKNKSSRPFLSFLKTSSPCRPPISQCRSKELPLLPLEPPFKPVGPARPPPQVPCPPCPGAQNPRAGSKDEVDTPDYLFPPMRFGSPGPNASPVSVNVRLESPLSTVVDDIGTLDNLFPPLRYGSPSDSPTQRPALLKRPLYPPPTNQDICSPENIFPQLRFGSPSSPGGIHHAAHARTTSNTNTASRLRSAALQSPITSDLTTPQRLRSATVESSNTFGTPRVIARDFASPATTRPVGLSVQISCPTSPKHRRRPSKLTLRTTNLTELQPGETTPTPQNPSTSTTAPYLTPLENPHPASATTKRTRNARERRRSRSTGDLESLLLRQGNHRASRSESHKLAAFPVEVGGSDTESREVYTPASVLSVTSIVSDATISPDKPTGSRFDNVPLPWSTQPLSTLLPTLPVEYLSTGQETLTLRTPYILAPNTLLALSSEEDRLRLEAERLKVKHTTLSQRRDKVIARLGVQHRSGDIMSGLQAVQEVIARVDRVARQIYICNDQVRQMEVMKRDHEVGVILWALDQARVERQNMEIKVFRGVEEERMVVPVPDIQLTRATLYETDYKPEDEGYEILNSPAVEEEDAYADILSAKERPLSIISIASGRFGFPIPPSRPSVDPPSTLLS